MSSHVVGFDPGVSGAIAVLDASGALIDIHDMPVFQTEKKVAGKAKKKSHLNVHAVGNFVRPFAGSLAVIERVASRPGEGSVSSFTFGFGAGALHGIAGAFEMRIENPTPAQWKKHFRLSSDKGAARQLATRRWPDKASWFTRAKDDGRAEAALIALYAIETSSLARPALMEA
ncbi:hypothetical protein NO932_11700 [Pelagibacterium sp. 26DY04]|uniref:hypothetical protein n=1 Tax=Pelagibacterium sp. 26DY04 TaxID=2967130 RepID=UPI002815B165|nr:hypothetical protein [Pelagibacterium sp. 26DY04]WMT85592.1 hypothetical protein NO932_11700 [Pelagibacterium sp. 26DY04]